MKNEIKNEALAAKAIKDALGLVTMQADSETEDTLLHENIVEGETGFYEAVSSVLGEIREEEILLAGLNTMITALSARKERIAARIGRLRACIEQGMMIAELKKMTLPDCTLTLRTNSPAVQIINEAEIPAAYWKPRDPVVDKRAIADSLKSGMAVPGAVLDNGSVSLQVRRG